MTHKLGLLFICLFAILFVLQTSWINNNVHAATTQERDDGEESPPPPPPMDKEETPKPKGFKVKMPTDELGIQIFKLQKDFKETQHRLRAMRARNSELNEELNALKPSEPNSEKEKKNLMGEIKKLQEVMKSASDHESRVSEELERLRDERSLQFESIRSKGRGKEVEEESEGQPPLAPPMDKEETPKPKGFKVKMPTDELGIQIFKLQKDFKETQHRLRAMRARNSELNEELNALKPSEPNSENEKKRLQREIKKLQEEIKITTDHESRVSEELERLRDERSPQFESLRSKGKKVEEAPPQEKEEERDVKTRILNMKKNLEEYGEMRSELESSASGIQKKIGQLKEESPELQKEHSSLLHLINTTKKAENSLKEQIKYLEAVESHKAEFPEHMEKPSFSKQSSIEPSTTSSTTTTTSSTS